MLMIPNVGRRDVTWLTASLAIALATTALVLGGPWMVLVGFAALCAAIDRVIPHATGTAGEADRAFRRLVRQRRWAQRTGRTSGLDVLDDAHPWVRVARRRDRGVCSIPIDSLIGTVEPLKARQFDRAWRPNRSAHERWRRLWLGRHSGSPIPPVSVFRVDGAHWVRDGHHRASVARHQGAPSLEAEVVELLRWNSAPCHD